MVGNMSRLLEERERDRGVCILNFGEKEARGGGGEHYLGGEKEARGGVGEIT
jgi:hypothetical protein